MILFGGKQAEGHRFCSEACLRNGSALLSAHKVPEEVVKQHALRIHAGPCPKCQQSAGPVDVYVVHEVWSALVVTSWRSELHLSCRSCGVKAQAAGLASCLVLGWWGFPWGLIMTPVQVGRNVRGLLRRREAMQPSEELEQLVRSRLAALASTPGWTGSFPA